MLTIKDRLIQLMQENNVDGNPEDVIETVSSFLFDYGLHVELTEPHASNTIIDIRNVASMMDSISTSEFEILIQGQNQ